MSTFKLLYSKFLSDIRIRSCYWNSFESYKNLIRLLYSIFFLAKTINEEVKKVVKIQSPCTYTMKQSL